MQIHLDKINEMLLKTGKRNPSFLKMIEHIGRIDNPLIIETGCSRQERQICGPAKPHFRKKQSCNDKGAREQKAYGDAAENFPHGNQNGILCQTIFISI